MAARSHSAARRTDSRVHHAPLVQLGDGFAFVRRRYRKVPAFLVFILGAGAEFGWRQCTVLSLLLRNGSQPVPDQESTSGGIRDPGRNALPLGFGCIEHLGVDLGIQSRQALLLDSLSACQTILPDVT